jgi:hypothetical protein
MERTPARELDRPDVRAVAAMNNAAWCDLVARLHGIDGSFRWDAWASPVRTPDFYPDAVTLDPAATADRVIGLVDPSVGCSIKDSFAALDLAPWGFARLFEATWVGLEAGAGRAPRPRLRWRRVRDPGELERWETAWRDEPSGPRLFLPGLLEHPEVAVLAAGERDDIAAGGILNLGGGAVGISNAFAGSSDPIEPYAGCVATANDLFPGMTLVGYESDEALDAATTAGFRPLGPLTVWLRE